MHNMQLSSICSFHISPLLLFRNKFFFLLSILGNSKKKVGRKGFPYVCDKFSFLKTHVFEHQALKIIRVLWTEDSFYFYLWITKFYKGWHSGRVLFVVCYVFKVQTYKACLKRIFLLFCRMIRPKFLISHRKW